MRTLSVLLFAAGIWMAASAAHAQTSAHTVEAHRALAQAAAGQDFKGVYEAACTSVLPGAMTAAPAPARPPAAAGPRPEPPREQWYAEPVKVFDNLYFVGTKIHNAWAVTTSDGIIVIEALFSYAAGPEIGDGLKKLGLDPATIKYVIISHGHSDHSGGAEFLQHQYKPHLIMTAADWDLVERNKRDPTPQRDIVATDGQKVTLGDTTLTLYVTPGHTPGTISILVPVKDHGQPHVAVEWGGTVVSTRTPAPMLESYVKSAERFSDIAIGSGADVIITNHTAFDDSLKKLAAVQNRKPGDPNPYIIGKDSVKRYLTVAEECGKATILAQKAQPGGNASSQ